MTKTSKNWYAVYTKSRAEKKVKIELEIKGITHYLPLKKFQRQWSDRKKWVETPLISGYIFVYISPTEYDEVLKTDGVVCYVCFEGKAAIIHKQQIENIKKLLQLQDQKIKLSRENFEKGDKIEIISGLLVGTKGKLIDFKGKKKVAIELNQLNISFLFELPLSEIQKIIE